MEISTTRTHTQTLKEKQRQERERLILAAAEEVLYENGYHDTSIDEIAARVGVAKGTVYLHFSSKEDLIAAVFTANFERFLRALDEVITETMTPRAQLETILARMYEGYYVRLIQLLYNNADLKKLFQARKQQHPPPWDALVSRVIAILEAGKARGDFDQHTPTKVMASAFFCLLSPTSYERLVIAEHMEVQALVDYLGRIYFDGVTNAK
ncbi:TetR/AcrR family transcriptional regulator [Ktedonospora formicarum]|uniref:HTH tetR-type domain-containing protein n=1 Tax=Ktedonospora formicarum TaxID=2778364 RepID=A0A8J3IC83_9CHLR|nr:TetR/AcrR family transcriptional regulator [Ktedonospora formicarum]GHO49987.1 hypothetical protein KSX_81500 [Ktedonospora formicarum]